MVVIVIVIFWFGGRGGEGDNLFSILIMVMRIFFIVFRWILIKLKGIIIYIVGCGLSLLLFKLRVSDLDFFVEEWYIILLIVKIRVINWFFELF